MVRVAPHEVMIGGEVKRESLQLNFSRSISAPAEEVAPLPVPTRLRPLSLPTSPSCDLADSKKALVMSRVRYCSCQELAKRLSAGRSPTCALLDVRPFMLYNQSHIQGATNLNCMDRFNRRRLQLGKASLAELASSKEAKELLKRRTFREFVVCDEGTTDLALLPASHPLFMVLGALLEDNRDPVLLTGEDRVYRGGNRRG